MAAGAGVALKFLQWFVRGVQFCCAALVLAIYSYFLATLHNHNLPIDTWIRAVEGISGIAVVYTGIALFLLCCLAGHPITAFIAIVLDVCFVAGFIYVASANRGGVGSCNGYVSTAFGSGDANTNVVDNGSGGFTALPSLRQSCQLESACLAVSIVAIFFFIFSAILEVVLARHRKKEQRFGPSPANDYTSGYGKRRGLLSLRRKRNAGAADPNALPVHTDPSQVRDSYATEQTRVGSSHGEPLSATGNPYAKHGEAGHGNLAGPHDRYDHHTGLSHSTNGAAAPAPYEHHGHPGLGEGDSVTAFGPVHNRADSGYAHQDSGVIDNRYHGDTHPAPAHFLAANYRYDDGVYGARA